jgi:hypothetical protein
MWLEQVDPIQSAHVGGFFVTCRTVKLFSCGRGHHLLQIGFVIEGRAGSHQQVIEKLGWKLSQRMS